jgi:hypothetical protein
MVLRRREPFRELRQMQENMDRLWHSFGHEGGEAGNAENYEYGILSITFPRIGSKKAKRLQITRGQESEGQITEAQTSQEQASSGS